MLIIVLKANGDTRRIHCCASLDFFNQYQTISLIYMLLKFPYECQKKMLECKVNSCNKISLYRESSFSLFAKKIHKQVLQNIYEIPNQFNETICLLIYYIRS